MIDEPLFDGIPDTPDVLPFRRGVCEEVARRLEAHFRLDHVLAWDRWIAAEIIGTVMPPTIDEAWAEWEAFQEAGAEQADPPVVTPLQRLRIALGACPGLGVDEVVQTACDRLGGR